ncbi:MULTISPECIES: TIGR03085 family metal-binding protein [unclassified Nocardioides]|uniref:TIGR03085 family metal-binding protein n=1 Tax=unclassified Nocardioides TaxID=2615069 RepID=UPI00360CD90F
MTAPLARRERAALCDLALETGPDSPTLCAGWTARDLVVHLLVRERRPLASAGIVVPPLSALTSRASRSLEGRSYESLVARLRSPGGMYAVPALDRALNTFEYVVHHEDLRRGLPDWQPRTLPPADVDLLWANRSRGVAFLARKLPAPTVLRRADTGDTIVASKGDSPVTVTGDVVELLLFLFGRSATSGITFEGPDDRVASVRSASLGV